MSKPKISSELFQNVTFVNPAGPDLNFKDPGAPALHECKTAKAVCLMLPNGYGLLCCSSYTYSQYGALDLELCHERPEDFQDRFENDLQEVPFLTHIVTTVPASRILHPFRAAAKIVSARKDPDYANIKSNALKGLSSIFSEGDERSLKDINIILQNLSKLPKRETAERHLLACRPENLDLIRTTIASIDKDGNRTCCKEIGFVTAAPLNPVLIPA